MESLMDYMDDVIKEVFSKIFNELAPEEVESPSGYYTTVFKLPETTRHRAVKYAIMRDVFDNLKKGTHER
jgi:hypothetical protein